jgi:retinol-binding protein 3
MRDPTPAGASASFASVGGRLSTAVALFLMLMCSQAAGQQPSVALDRDMVRDAVESLAEIVAREYFDADVARRIASSLRQGLASGRYDAARTPDELASLLTRHLFATSHDRHLGVTVIPTPSALPMPGAPAETREVRGRRTNFGVQRVEILAGNVGYLNLRWFWRPEEAEAAVAAAMSVLSSADALIVDMRENSGGSPGTVALLASYLFDSPDLPLFVIVPRDAEAGDWYRTVTVPVEHDARRPVFVLTSGRTFSAGEGFAYILQERGRAEVIGERTPGAANPGRAYAVSDWLEATVPNSYVRTAVRRDNWEGVGVQPDIEVSASDALHVAHVRALRRLIASSPTGSWRETLERELAALEADGR